MLTTLQTSYTDTRAGDLAWCLGGDPLPALAVRDLRLANAGRPGPPGTLQLRLLGASHQVVIAAGPGRCLETVACLPGRRTPLLKPGWPNRWTAGSTSSRPGSRRCRRTTSPLAPRSCWPWSRATPAAW